MKKIRKFNFVIGIAIILLLNGFNNYALSIDRPPCWMDCPNSIWEKDYTSFKANLFCPGLSMDCQNADITIEFWHRHAQCDGFGGPVNEYDCQITKIILPVNCMDNCLQSKGIFEFYKIAQKKVLDAMRVLYPENKEEIWRAVNVPCWGRLQLGGMDVLEYCPTVEPVCCWKRYRIEGDGYTIIDAFIPQSGQDTCLIATYPCQYVCDMGNLEEPPPPVFLGVKSSELKVSELNTLEEKVIKPNLGSYIELFDLKGALIMRTIININLKSELTNLKIGQYVFYIIKDTQNQVVEKGKIIIN